MHDINSLFLDHFRNINYFITSKKNNIILLNSVLSVFMLFATPAKPTQLEYFINQ